MRYSSWQDRIPFLLIFEIATSIELFQEKLSRQTICHLQGTAFEGRDASEILDVLFKSATTREGTKGLWIGSGASKLLLDRQTEHIPSANSFITSLKVSRMTYGRQLLTEQYMYLTHFYNNALSVMLSKEQLPLTKHHFATIRNLQSFKR